MGGLSIEVSPQFQLGQCWGGGGMAGARWERLVGRLKA